MLSTGAVLAAAAAATSGVAVGDLVSGVRAARSARAKGARAAASPPDPPDAPRSPRSLRGAVAVLARLGRGAGIPVAASRTLALRVDAAGLPARVDAGDVMGVKLGAALVGLLAAAVLLPLLPGRLGLVAGPGLPVVAFLAPELWLARRARRRGARMVAEAPDVLDLLRVAVAAGLPVGRALGEVGRRHRGLLAGELAAAAARVELGESGGVALARLRRRSPVPVAAAFVAAVARSERHGVPLAPALAALAANARAEHARRLADRAARATPKIQLVVALLLVPAVLLLVAAALVTSLAPG